MTKNQAGNIMRHIKTIPNPDNVYAENLRKSYSAPVLRFFGSVSELTQNGNGTGTDGGTTPGMTMQSDRNLKENIVRIGEHPLGLGLYLFDYRQEHREQCGYGRKFGVMADEVEMVMPSAVSTGRNGYKTVNYGMLGINLAV